MVHEHARWAGWYPRMLWGSASPCWVGRDGRYFSHACTLNVMWLPTTKLYVTPRETTALRFYASAGQIHQTWSFRGPGRQILLPSSRANIQTFVLFFTMSSWELVIFSLCCWGQTASTLEPLSLQTVAFQYLYLCSIRASSWSLDD